MATRSGYDEMSGYSYDVHVQVCICLNRNPNLTEGTIPLRVVYSGPDRTHFIQGFYLNRVPQISGLDHVSTWLSGSPCSPPVVGTTTVELVTRALTASPTTNVAMVKIKVWRDEREACARAAMERVEKFAITEAGEEICAVCMEEFRVGFEAARLPCHHVFHGECIEKWFEKRISCPLCRFELIVDEVTASASTS